MIKTAAVIIILQGRPGSIYNLFAKILALFAITEVIKCQNL